MEVKQAPSWLMIPGLMGSGSGGGPSCGQVTCRLCVIDVREDNDSNVKVMITPLIWITWTSLPTHPPTHSYSVTPGYLSTERPLDLLLLCMFYCACWFHSYLVCAAVNKEVGTPQKGLLLSPKMHTMGMSRGSHCWGYYIVGATILVPVT